MNLLGESIFMFEVFNPNDFKSRFDELFDFF